MMEINLNECRVYYRGKEIYLPFEKELKQLFKDNGFKMWASGYGCEIRDLCFKKIKAK